MYSAYWQPRPPYDSHACCLGVSFEGNGLFSCISIFISSDLNEFLSLSHIAEEVQVRLTSEWSLVCTGHCQVSHPFYS